MDPLQQMGEREMTGCYVRVKNSAQENEAVFHSAFQGSGISLLSDCLVVVELCVFETSLIIKCHISWFLKCRRDNRIKPILIGAVVGSASRLLFLFFLFFCSLV